MSNNTFWNTAARYCAELAPVVGPLLHAASDLAYAIERAALPASVVDTPAQLPGSPEND